MCSNDTYFFIVVDENRETTISRINSKLPSCIKVQAIRKVTKNFNAKSAADARTYIYFLPTFAFAPVVPINEQVNSENVENSENSENVEKSENAEKSEKVEDSEHYKVTRDFRMSEDLRKTVNETLKEFIGSHYYHNYTSGK